MVAGTSEGAVLSKCDVRDHMQQAFNRLPEQILLMLDTEELMAKIVCHVELTSGFNTSAVNKLTVPHDEVEGPPKRGGGRRGRRSPGAGGSRFSVAKFMGSSSSEEEGSGGSSSSSSSSSEESAEERGDVWTLYGIFQLSDRVMCQSGSAPSLNLCQTDCQAFLDDDIADDIACAEEIKAKMMSSAGEHGKAKALIRKMMALFFQAECSSVDYVEYFASCQ